MITIISPRFLTSAAKLSQCPPPHTSEIAMLGRSNVGKSSFINALLESNLAKSSSTPGKTQLINFFTAIWNDTQQNLQIPLTLIDLPGIGYAKVSKTQQELWQYHLWEFLRQRSSIKLFIHLIDARHPDLPIDENLARQIQGILRGDQVLLPIYTKADKLKKNELARLRQQQVLFMTNDAAAARAMYRAKEDDAPSLLDHVRKKIYHTALGISH